jgi:hypothetical protein
VCSFPDHLKVHVSQNVIIPSKGMFTEAKLVNISRSAKKHKNKGILSAFGMESYGVASAPPSFYKSIRLYSNVT